MGNWTFFIATLTFEVISYWLLVSAGTVNELSIQFLVEPEDVIVSKNSQFTWNCNASGINHIAIEWRKKGNLDTFTDDAERRVFVTRTGALRFNKVRVDKDPGIYYCLAKDSYGSIRSKFAELQVSRMSKKFDVIPSGNVTLYRGGQLHLSCKIKAIPLAQIWWLRNKKNLSESEDKRIIVDYLTGDLLIKNMKLRDSGRYRCVALHQGRKKFSPDVSVAVHKIDKTAMPTILYSPGNVTAFVNDYLVLTVAANMPVYVQWSFSNVGGHKNQPPINYIPIPLDGHSQHFIRNIRTDHDGIWTCTVIAIHNHKSIRCPPTYLKVISPPRIACYMRHFTFKLGMPGLIKIINLTSIVRPVGGILNYECKVFGQPKPKILWLHNGNTIRYNYQSSRHQLSRQATSSDSSSNEVYSFGMNQIEGKDKGYYQIGASNEAGSSYSMPFMLTVEEYPVPSPPRNLRSISVTAYEVTLAWDASKSNLNPEIYYTIDFWAIDDPALIYSETTSRLQESITINKDLKPWRQYTFVIKAWNYRAASQPSNKLTVKTAEDVPTASPRTVKLMLVSASFVVKWERVDPLYENGKIMSYIISCTEMKTGKKNIYHAPSYSKDYKIADVLPNSIYLVQIAAATAVGAGPFSRPQRIKTNSEYIHNKFASLDMQILYINASTIIFTWEIGNRSKQYLIGYQLDYRPYGISKNKKTLRLSSKALNYSLVGLQSSTEYDISISGIYKTANESGYGPSADRIISTTLGNVSISAPNKITNLHTNVIGSKSLIITWQKPKVADTITLTRYLLSYRSVSWNKNGNLTMINIEKEANDTKINNLTPYTSYEICVSYFVYSKYSGELSSKPTTSILVRTRQDIPESPPIVDVVEELSPGVVSITWNTPKLANGIITMYEIKYKSQSDLDWKTERTKKNNITLKDITPKQFFELTLAAATTVGMGPSSTITIILNVTDASAVNPNLTYPVPTVNSETVTGKNIFQESLRTVGIICAGICGAILLAIAVLYIIRSRHHAIPQMKEVPAESNMVASEKQIGVTKPPSKNYQRQKPSPKGITILQSSNCRNIAKETQCKEGKRTNQKGTKTALKCKGIRVSDINITIHQNNLSS